MAVVSTSVCKLSNEIKSVQLNNIWTTFIIRFFSGNNDVIMNLFSLCLLKPARGAAYIITFIKFRTYEKDVGRSYYFSCGSEKLKRCVKCFRIPNQRWAAGPDATAAGVRLLVSPGFLISF